MQDIIYDIHSKSPLIIGYAGETNARNAVFKGYNKVKDNSSIVINIKGIGSRPLVNFCLPVKYTYTKDEGTYEAYLCELITENGVITYERHSNNFEMLVKHSAPLETEATPSEEQFDDWSAEITGAIADLNGRAASGEFDGEDGFSPTVNITKTGRTTTITITDKSGTHTATVTDGADGGAYDDTSIKNRLNAIEGKEEEWNAKAETTDIPTKVSELQNDKGYLTEHQDISGLVEKVDGKGLSTNDYDNNAKNKVDAIPANAKYTDTVYDDTAVKGRLNAIEDMADGSVTKQLNDDLATKVGYSEVENGQLKMYSDSTKSHLLATLDLPTTDLTDYVKNTDYGTASKAGTIKSARSLTISGTDGSVSCDVMNLSKYNGNGNYIFISRGTLENVKTDLVGRALADDTATAYTSEQQTKAIARIGAEPKKGEWVLKGTMTLDSLTTSGALSYLNVDMSGCTEFYVYGTITSSSMINLYCNSMQLIYSISNNQSRKIYAHWEDNSIGIESISAKSGGSTESSLVTQLTAYNFANNLKTASITRFSVNSISNITELNIQIYAR